MKIYEFLRKVTEIELSQVKYVFGDWDLALEEYVNKCERHRAPNVMALLKLSSTLGELVDLYRGLELKRYPIPEAELEAKKQRYDTLMEYCLRGNGGHLSMFERITNGSRMEQRLNFIYEMQLMANAIQGKDVKLTCRHNWKELKHMNDEEIPYSHVYLLVCTKCGKFKQVKMKPG